MTPETTNESFFPALLPIILDHGQMAGKGLHGFLFGLFFSGEIQSRGGEGYIQEVMHYSAVL
jgi:hypothetical protein